MNATNRKFRAVERSRTDVVFPHCLNMQHLTPAQRQRFSNFIKTDGEAISFIFRKEIVTHDPVQRMTLIRQRFCRNEYPQIGSIDAGLMYPIVFHVAEPAHNYRETTGYLSSARLQAEFRSDQHKSIIARVTKGYTKIQKSIIAICLKRFDEAPSSRSAEYRIYRIYRSKILNKGYEERVVNPQVARYMFRYYRRRQAVAARIANEIAGE